MSALDDFTAFVNSTSSHYLRSTVVTERPHPNDKQQIAHRKALSDQLNNEVKQIELAQIKFKRVGFSVCTGSWELDPNQPFTWTCQACRMEMTDMELMSNNLSDMNKAARGHRWSQMCRAKNKPFHTEIPGHARTSTSESSGSRPGLVNTASRGSGQRDGRGGGSDQQHDELKRTPTVYTDWAGQDSKPCYSDRQIRAIENMKWLKEAHAESSLLETTWRNV